MRNIKVLSIVKNELKNDNRVQNQAISLKSSGYDVTVLAIQRKSKLPSNESIDGVNVIRITKTYKIIDKIPFVRVLIFKFFIVFNLIKLMKKNNYNFIHCHDLYTLHLGFFIKIFNYYYIVFIYDAHEFETNRNFVTGYKRVIAKIKERLLIQFCDKVITVSDSIADKYVELYGIQKPVVILNCPVFDPFKELVRSNIFREKFNIPASNKIFLYQGHIVVGRGIEIILNAFNELDNENISLVFMGEGSLIEVIKNDVNYNKSVFIHPFVKSSEIIEHTSSADFGISFIEDISLSDRYCLPNKLFEYIASGLPVITSGLPEMKKFVENYNVGIAANKNTIEGFIIAYRELLNMDTFKLKKNIKKTRKLYHWGSQEKILVDLYQSLEPS